MSARREIGPSADPPTDPLAGATIVVHDLSHPNVRTVAGRPATGGRDAGELPDETDAATKAASPAAAPDRWWPLRYLLVAAAFGLFGFYAHATWQGRPPTPISFGTLGAAPKVEIRVHVDGAVAQPGVYKLAQGDRVEDAVKAAGGLASHADQSKLNMAQRVRDEQRLDVPALPNAAASALETLSGAAPPEGQPTSAGSTSASGSSGTSQPAPTNSAPSQSASSARPTSTPRPQATARPTTTPRPQPTARATAFAGGRVNVNTATQAQLEQLPGLGATSAQRILTYRAANGPLRSLDDVRKAGVQEQFVRQAADFLSFE